MAILHVGRAYPLPAIDLTVPSDYRGLEADVEDALETYLLDHLVDAVVWRQYRGWPNGIPDLIVKATSPLGNAPSLTVIEIKPYAADRRALNQLSHYMADATRSLRADPQHWILQGALATPGIRIPRTDWPAWFMYMPLRLWRARAAA